MPATRGPFPSKRASTVSPGLPRWTMHERLLGPDQKRRVFETLVDGDLTVRTDGEPYRGGVLYQVEFTSPGEFANKLGAQVIPADQIQRTRRDDPDCQ
jgi:hypothetical protein